MKLLWAAATAVLFFSPSAGESLLCGAAGQVKLQQRGRTSAVSLTLGARGRGREPCSLDIFAPHVYALSLRLIDAQNPFAEFAKTPPSDSRATHNETKEAAECMLNVYYLDVNESAAIPIWKVAPCSPDFSIAKSSSSSQLISPPVKIEWRPSSVPSRTDSLRLIVTAVNSGETCRERDQITCLRAGLEPLLCVSDALACDGVKHCPAGGKGDDESNTLCRAENSNWVQELLKRLASTHGELLGVEMITSRPSNSTTKRVVKVPKERTRHRKGLSALDAALEPYGTWGYLMLGMLICATVLILFGVWECFCHYSRTSDGLDQSMPPDCIAPSAICSSHPQNWRPYPPPSYDDVEPPPPSYSVLFPAPPADDKTIQPASTSDAVIENGPSV